MPLFDEPSPGRLSPALGRAFSRPSLADEKSQHIDLTELGIEINALHVD